MSDIDLDAIDPNAPTEEQLRVLSNGSELRYRLFKGSPRRLKDEIDHLKARLAAAAPPPSHDDDLVPDNPYDSEHDTELDRVIEGIGILEAYDRWCGKMQPKVSNKRSNIMVSCPIPGHPDKNPSADINLDKGDGGVWVCHACQQGGDKFDLAAIAKGFAWPESYKTDGTFPELRRQMAGDFGYIVKRGPDGKDRVTEIETVYETDSPDPEPEPEPDNPPQEPRETDNPISTTPVESLNPADKAPQTRFVGPNPLDVHELPEPPEFDDDDDPDEPDSAPLTIGFDVESTPGVDVGSPLAPLITLHPDADSPLVSDEAAKLDWDEIVPNQTFLREYLEQTCKFDIPHEYHFWLALQAIAFANGFNVRLDDVPVINSNLFLVLVGPTGLGKSRATYPARTLIKDVFPWTGTPTMTGTGVKILGGVESGPALIKGIMHEYEDPATTTPGTLIQQPNIRGWTIPEEFAGFVKKAMRMGSDFKERAIEFYDVGREGDVTLTAIKHGGEVKALGPFLQITSTTQPEAIHHYLTAEDVVGGFLNRFIFAAGPCRAERPSRWTAAHAPKLDRAADGLRAIAGFADHHDGLLLSYTDAGSIAWDHLYRRIEILKSTGPMAVRLDLFIKKVMTLFALNEHKTVIDADLVDRMEPVMNHLLMNFTKMTGDLYWRPDDDCQDAIMRYLQHKNADGLYPRKSEIVAAVKRPTMGRSRFDAGRALDLLEKIEMIEVVDVQAGKRGPKRRGYRIGTATGTGYSI
jgi:hypothetical protein